MSIFDNSFLLLIKVVRPQTLLMTFVLCGKGAIAESTACDWYAELKNLNFHLKDASCCDSPVEFGDERLSQLKKIII